MTLKLFELVGTDAARPFSPFCWRNADGAGAQGAVGAIDPVVLHRKGKRSPRTNPKKVPVLLDGEKRRRRFPGPSRTIWKTLTRTGPRCLAARAARAVGRMLNWWGDVTVIAGMFPLIVADIPKKSRAGGRGLFPQDARGAVRKTAGRGCRRPRQGGRRLSQIARSDAADTQHAKLSRRRRAQLCRLHRVRRVFSGRASSARFKLLSEDDPVYAWRERLLDAFDGMARKSPGYPV